jgi:hypothetical protein
MNTAFICPYYRFLIKCSTSKEHYLSCKRLTLSQDNLKEMLFYSINMLLLLSQIIQKVATLGRFYKDTNTQVLCSAVETIAVQS